MPAHQTESKTEQIGKVIASFGARVQVITETGETFTCSLQTKRQLVVCGDRVGFQIHDSNDAVIQRILPRRTVLERADERGRKKPVAANIDRLFIVSAPKPGIQRLNIDRYLVLAESLQIAPILIFHKSDLPENLESLVELYRHLDYSVCRTSSKTENGLDELMQALRGHTGILLGESGVGKSSIIKRLVGDQDIRIGALSDSSGLGTHTTSSSRLYHLPQGGELIDSPGVREFVAPNLSREQIRQGYREINHFARACRFSDCAHLIEPGCAVRAAVAADRIDAGRWQTYQAQMNSL